MSWFSIKGFQLSRENTGLEVRRLEVPAVRLWESLESLQSLGPWLPDSCVGMRVRNSLIPSVLTAIVLRTWAHFLTWFSFHMPLTKEWTPFTLVYCGWCRGMKWSVDWHVLLTPVEQAEHDLAHILGLHKQEEKFSAVWSDKRKWIKFHKKPPLPTFLQYRLSLIIKP